MIASWKSLTPEALAKIAEAFHGAEGKILYYSYHRVIMRIIVALVALALQAGACLASNRAVDTIARSFTVAGRPTPLSRTVDGQTRITAGSAPTIQVKAVKEVIRAANDQEGRRAAEKIEVRIEQLGNRIEVEVKHPWEAISLWKNARLRVQLEIVAPAACDLDVRSVDGAVVVEGFNGRLDLTSGDGEASRHIPAQASSRLGQ